MELLACLHETNRQLGRSHRLSEDQMDELSLYCWGLEQCKPTGMLWGRARELWGGAPLSRPGLRRSRRPESKAA